MHISYAFTNTRKITVPVSGLKQTDHSFKTSGNEFIHSCVLSIEFQETYLKYHRQYS